jgi:uncharacterized protein (TIGR03067 family)
MNNTSTSRRRFLQASGACLALPWLKAQAFAQDNAAAAIAADLRAMQGRWILMSWQDDGYDATFGGKGPAEITITDNLFRYQVFGSPNRMHDDDQITLDPSKQPKRFFLRNPRLRLRDGNNEVPYLRNGAYRIDGDELRVTLNMKSVRDISLNLDNSRDRPGVRQGTMIDGYREESDKLYVMMREEGYTAGTMATATNLTAGMVPHSRRPSWTAGREEGRLTADANWQRLRFWFTATEPNAVRVNLGGDNVLRLGAVTPDQVRGATQGRADLFRYPTATLGEQTAHGGDVPYRANIGMGPERRGAEPFWFSVDLRRRDGELRVWMTGQTVMTSRVGAAASPVNVTVGPGVQIRELRWLT